MAKYYTWDCFWMAAWMLLVCVLIWACTGCASVTYSKNEEGEETFKYRRLGNQKIAGFTASKNDDGTMAVELKGQESSVGEAMEAVKNMTEVIKKGAGIP